MLGKVNINPMKVKPITNILVKDRYKSISNYNTNMPILVQNVNISLCSSINIGGGVI